MTNKSLTSKPATQSSNQPFSQSPSFTSHTEVNLKAQHATALPAETPDYLLPDVYCSYTTPIAVFLSALTMVILFYITINWSTLMFHTPINHQLNLFIETAFVILCTIATWKHSKK